MSDAPGWGAPDQGPNPPGQPDGPPPGWWQASDGRWYPPPQPGAGPAPGPAGPPGQPDGPPPGWWQASDGRWYPPTPGTQGYGTPAWGGGPPTRDKGAVRSLVLGIVGLLFCPIIFSVAAIYEGYQCRKRVAASNGALEGDGLGLAGIILGVVGLALMPFTWLVLANG